MAMILDAFVSKLSEMLLTAVEEEAAMLFNVSDEINKLRGMLLKIQGVLEDAERRRIEDKSINDWLIELKDVMYDADDILDEWMTIRKREAQSSSGSSVRCQFPLLSCFRKLIFTHAIGRKIKSLKLRLERISDDRDKLDLRTSSPKIPVTSRQIIHKSYPIPESDIVGMKIHEDTRSLVESLTTKDERQKILVFGITGIGGVGKTTLAQKVFNDDKIKVAFPIRTWLSISREFNEDDLLREIITSAGGHDSGASLMPRVQRVLEDKRFLLVLDDVWNADVWNNLLRNAVQVGAAGSRVLVTTRNEEVAKQMNVVHFQRVDLLSLQDGWSLLCKKVVLGGGEGEIQGLKDIGMQIVKKCDGLPLAITTVGGLVCVRERNRRAWQEVLDSAEWSRAGLPTEVHRALYLSYMDLPSHLKQCFLYCSLLEKDKLTYRDFICQYWIAEGFIKAEGNLTLEATALKYYRELVRRCLLQPHPLWYGQSDFNVHDLLRSLAQFLARDENLHVGKPIQSESNEATLGKLRRLSIMDPVGGASTFLDIIRKHGSLRVLFLDLVQTEGIADSCTRCKGLRLLVLQQVTIEKLPPSIGDLIHLRLLYIWSASITQLPDSIGDLINLQFLVLKNCLHLRSLPKSIVRLRNLRCLLLDPDTQLEGMPVGLKGLQHLQILSFVVNGSGGISKSYNMPGHPPRPSEWCSLEELRYLPHLHELHVMKIEMARIDDDTRVRGSVINTKQHLEDLVLLCSSAAADGAHNGRAYDSEEIQRIQEVFELVLSPPPCLENLQVYNFFGLHFPSWIGSSYLPNLRTLQVANCMHCQQLPPFGTLPNLEFLQIEVAIAVTIIGPEFLGQEGGASSKASRRGPHGSSRPPPAILFPKLEELQFTNMPNWEAWQWDLEEGDGVVAFPCLKKFILVDCPFLKSLPSGFYRHATSLTKLVISDASSLKEVESLPSLKSLEIYNETHLERVSELPALEDLDLSSTYIDYMPRWLFGGQKHFPALRKLLIRGTTQLLRRCLVGGPDWPAIEYILNVYGCTWYGSYYFSYTKSPFPFTTNLDDDNNNEEEASNSIEASNGDSGNDDDTENAAASANRYAHTRWEPLTEWANRTSFTSDVYHNYKLGSRM